MARVGRQHYGVLAQREHTSHRELAVTNLQIASAFVGLVMPLVVSLVNQTHWKSQIKGLVAILVSLVAAFLTSWIAGDLNGKSFATSFLIVLGATLTTYRIFWKPTGIADTVESATTVKKNAPTTTAPSAATT
jgi:VIT1/CCC1 family predicted Fe2+/Mn2+ transporter